MVGRSAQLTRFGRLFGIIDADDRSSAVIQGMVERPSLCFDGPAWHVNRGDPRREFGACQGFGCGDIIAFHYQNYLQQRLRMVELAQRCEQMANNSALFEHEHYDGDIGQGCIRCVTFIFETG